MQMPKSIADICKITFNRWDCPGTRIDQEEFYQLLTYTDDVDLNKKLEAWENFYNFNRPHGAFEGKTPCEALKCTFE